MKRQDREYDQTGGGRLFRGAVLLFTSLPAQVLLGGALLIMLKGCGNSPRVTMPAGNEQAAADAASSAAGGLENPSVPSATGGAPARPQPAQAAPVPNFGALSAMSAQPGMTAQPGSGRDCRDDWKEFPWTRKGQNECTKCWTCKGEGFLPGMSYVACKIEDKCYRFATMNNCDYNLFPHNSIFPAQRDENLYCRKDGPNYSYFVCRVNGKKYPFQTVDGSHYYDKTANSGNMVGNVADVLPIIGGCMDKNGI
jgi:hypothetical protein